jgi:hypothetical protein
MDEPLADSPPTPADPPAPVEPRVGSGETGVRSAVRKPTRTRRPVTQRFLRELFTVTLGVLIALSLDGLKGWLEDRRLVTTARVAIERELSDNLEEVRIAAATADQRMEKLTVALRLANDLIESETSTVTRVDLGFELAEVSSASFDTAGRNGALALMRYEEARTYSRIYQSQQRFVDYQSRKFEELEAAAAYMAGDPYGALPGDIERFREHLLELVAMENIEAQLMTQLIEYYQSAMGGEQPSGSGS